jgi:hypothetical protein
MWIETLIASLPLRGFGFFLPQLFRQPLHVCSIAFLRLFALVGCSFFGEGAPDAGFAITGLADAAFSIERALRRKPPSS